MRKFTYKLVTVDGSVQEGVVSAITKGRARQHLEKSSEKLLFLERWRAGRSIISDLVANLKKFAPSEKINFFRDLSVMISAGLPLTESLDAAGMQLKNKKMNLSVQQMTQHVRNGKKLSQAMEKFPDYFSETMIHTVHAGEIAGKLSETLEKIAEDLEKDYELKRKVQSALAYPFVVIATMFLVLFGLVLYVFPEILKLFSEMEAELPMMTKIIFGGGEFILNYMAFILGAFVLGIVGLMIVIKHPKTRYSFHKATLKLPIFGDLIKEYNLVLFFRSVESLTSSGVSIVDSVDYARKTATNDVYRKTLETVHPLLLHGQPLSGALRPYPDLFPGKTQKIIEVGEKTGSLSTAFSRVSEHHEKSVHHKTGMLTVLIEPALMLIVGVVIGLIAVSIFLPIYQLTNVI